MHCDGMHSATRILLSAALANPIPTMGNANSLISCSHLVHWHTTVRTYVRKHWVFMLAPSLL